MLERPCRRVVFGEPPSQSGQVESLERGLNEPGAFLYSKVPANSADDALFLQRHGFFLADAAVTLERPISPVSVDVLPSRFAVPDDKSAVMDVAKRSFSFDRFHMDPIIPREYADRVKAEWVGNFFSGQRGDYLVVGLDNGKVAGFLQLLAPERTLTIDLIAVSPESRRKDLARAMLAFAEGRIPDMVLYRVGTQAANIPSMRLYENYGFRAISSSYTFHRHNP